MLIYREELCFRKKGYIYIYIYYIDQPPSMYQRPCLKTEIYFLQIRAKVPGH